MLWSPSQDRLLLVKRIDKDSKWEVPFELSPKAGENAVPWKRDASGGV